MCFVVSVFRYAPMNLTFRSAFILGKLYSTFTVIVSEHTASQYDKTDNHINTTETKMKVYI